MISMASGDQRPANGLNLSDGETDSAHIYWNYKSHRFEDWTL
jgi:hypothetical protein